MNPMGESDIEEIRKLLEENNILRIFENELTAIEKIGQGGQGKVYKGKFQGHLVAIKALTDLDLKNFFHELYILSQIDHPCIPRLYGLVVEKDNISLVTEFIEGVVLDQLISEKKLSFAEKVKITKNLSSVLCHIGSKNYIHRDLKPENMIVNLNTLDIYIIDFGIAKCLTDKENECHTRVMGTLFYMAPEIFQDNDENEDGDRVGTYTPKCDVWSFGCIISFLFSNIHPWVNKIRKDYLDKPVKMMDQIQMMLIKKDPFPIPEELDPNVKIVVKIATETDCEKRASMEEVRELISKLWL